MAGLRGGMGLCSTSEVSTVWFGATLSQSYCVQSIYFKVPSGCQAGLPNGLVMEREREVTRGRGLRKRREQVDFSRVAGVVNAAAGEGVGAPSVTQSDGFQALNDAIAGKDAEAVKGALDKLREAGYSRLWSSLPSVSRRSTFIRELTTMGIKNAEQLAIPSVRNDLAFLSTVVGGTSIVAVAASQLPGDWGFFVPYLVGSISLVVLAIGSVAPGLFQVAINSFSSMFPDYQERILRHEAAHFLTAYLVGLPILAYSLDLGKEHVNLVDQALQKKIYEGFLDSQLLDRLAVVSMAGLAAEGLKYDKVVGQSADLFSLQRLINRTKPPLSKEQQQNLTRWAVLYAGSLLKNKAKAYEALMAAMAQNAPIADCIKAIERA